MKRLSKILKFRSAYDEIDLEYLEIQGVFGPEIIDELSKKWKFQRTYGS